MSAKLKYFVLLCCIYLPVYGQQANGKLSSLLAAENYFSSIVKHKGTKAAFLQVSNKETIIYRPDPVKALSFFDKSADAGTKNLSWQPNMARIAKSGDWGFTTGTFQVREDEQTPARYGQYLSVWKVNDNGIWKLDLDMGISHPKWVSEPDIDFRDVKNANYYKQTLAKRLQQRKEVVLITDRLLNTALATKGAAAYQEFLPEHSRLLFSGREPLMTKQKIITFWKENFDHLFFETQSVDRSASGEWAYTQGRATLSGNGNSQLFNYVRIWELQEGFNWNLVLEMLSPAGN